MGSIQTLYCYVKTTRQFHLAIIQCLDLSTYVIRLCTVCPCKQTIFKNL